MVEALADANFSGGLVGHGAEGEGQSREPLVNLDEESSRTFHLKVIHLLKLALKDGAAGLVLTRLAFSGRDKNVEADDIAGGELELSDVVAWSGPVDDHIIAVNDVPLDLVRKHALDGVALVLLGDSLNDIGDFRVGGGLSDFSLGSLECVPSSQNHISLAASDGAIANNDRSGGVGGVAIEVGAANTAQNC